MKFIALTIFLSIFTGCLIEHVPVVEEKQVIIKYLDSPRQCFYNEKQKCWNQYRYDQRYSRYSHKRIKIWLKSCVRSAERYCGWYR